MLESIRCHGRYYSEQLQDILIWLCIESRCSSIIVTIDNNSIHSPGVGCAPRLGAVSWQEGLSAASGEKCHGQRGTSGQAVGKICFEAIV